MPKFITDDYFKLFVDLKTSLDGFELRVGHLIMFLMVTFKF